MQIKVLGKPKKPDYIQYADNLQDAYHKGYFSPSMTKYELLDRITKHNPSLRTYSSKTHTGLFDTDVYNPKQKESSIGFIGSIGKENTIPYFTILRNSDHYVLAHSWRSTLSKVKSKGYKIDEEGIEGEI